MKHILLFLFFIPTLVLASEYDNHFEKGGSGKNPYDFYEDIRKHDGNYNAIEKNYEDIKPNSVDASTIPQGVVDKGSSQDNNHGGNLGNSVKGKVSTEKSLSGVVSTMQNGDDLGTLGDTFLCPADNETYEDIKDCQKKCYLGCEPYKFNVQLSCQKSSEIMKVTPSHIGLNPPLSIKFRDSVYYTNPIKAVCGNGFIDMLGNSYEWTVDMVNKSLSFTVPYSNNTLGECKVMDKVYMSSFQNFLEPIAIALKTHVSKLGLVASHVINSDMSLSINVLVSGACDENSLKGELPNAQAIEDMKAGRLDMAQAQNIASADPNYQFLTDGKSYSDRACSIVNTPTIHSETKIVFESNEFKGVLPDVTKRNKGSTHVYNNGTLIGISQDGRHEEDFLPKLSGRFLSSSLLLGDFTNSNGDIYHGCNNGSAIAAGESCKIENRWIGSSVPYEFTVQVERSILEDIFSINSSNTCSNIPKDCKLQSETVCDFKGNNCVETVSNGLSNGVKVPKLCEKIATSSDNYMVCSDNSTITATGSKNFFSATSGYFNVTKTYSCSSKVAGDDYDYSAFLEQDKTISGSLNVTDKGDVSFSTIGRDGQQVNYNTNVTMNNTKCVQACKVKKPVAEETIIISDGSLSKSKDTVTSGGVEKPLETSYYKPCDKKEDKWECPLEFNESKVSECDCPDDFVDTILQMKFITESSKDMKCSSK